MSAAVMSTPIYECNEHHFKSGQKSKDPMSVQTGAGPIPLRRSYTSLVTLFEHHRKLDRSVSEPTSRYKTELCRPFEESGTCKYGDKCQFAHGYNELRNLTRHPKYKTELCRTFHTIGFCPYGPRCHFIHNFEEARIHNEKVNQQLGGVQPNIMGLTPFLNVSAAAVNLNISLLEQIATAPHQAITAINNIHSPLMRTNSLNIGIQHTAFTNPPLLKANSLSLMTHHHHNHQTNSVAIGTRPKPLNLSPTFSLGSTAESVSPSSSLSQSPTNSMASFFSDDCAAGNPSATTTGNANANLSTAFNFGQDFGLLATRQSPSPPGVIVNHHSVSDDRIPRTPSPLSPNNESRLPVFNRISSTIGDFENLKI
ncbi:tis11 zinc finger protein [Cotesia typhae]|uniref:tis11 zinc finger protein n=1 Tax=Cotesia typhae TaxID=2053667 RepID=UPI003D682E63